MSVYKEAQQFAVVFRLMVDEHKNVVQHPVNEVPKRYGMENNQLMLVPRYLFFDQFVA